ncbi:MAG: DUF2066 domain-containing protein [Gammaproteobacteria bacterium]|nr:DUF2066 domain-containing protein [Gammaproteobacteria bacterium]
MTRKTTRRWTGLVVALLLCAFFGPLAARDVGGLYNATVTVKDRSPAERSRASAAALGEVLVKLTGNRRTPNDASARPLLARASTLLLQYAYGQAPDGGLTFSAQFDEHVLERELEERGIGLWGKQRPDTVVFLVLDNAEGRSLVGGEAPGKLGDTLKRKAEARALPVLLPLMDIEESAALNQAKDWHGLSDGAVGLAGRYGAAAVLVGQLHEASAQVWEVRWRLDIDGETLEWTQEGASADAIVEEGVDALGDALARRYAEPGMLAGAERVSLAVTGVRSAADYARLARYLDTLDSISALFLRTVDNQRVVYEITARGGRAALAQAIGFGHVLAPVPAHSDTYELLP